MGGRAFSTTCHLRALRGGGGWGRNDRSGSGLSSSHTTLTTTASGSDFFGERTGVEKGKRGGGRERGSRFGGSDYGGRYLSLTNDDIVEESFFVPSQRELFECDISSEVFEGFNLVIKLSLGSGGAGEKIYEANLIPP